VIPSGLLRKLATDPTLPKRSREAFSDTLRLDAIARQHIGLQTLFSKSEAVITINDCGNRENLPGQTVDLTSSSDPVVQRAYLTTSSLLHFYREAFNRDSIDDHGCGLASSVHYSAGYCNAYWDEDAHYMVYGDGDGYVFNDFTSSDDFVGHELTHGVTQFASGFEYHDEPGALNESISDVFGSMFRQWKRKQSSQSADWRIGGDLIGSGGASHGWTCVRDLSDPGAAHCIGPQPKHMDQYLPGGDPHENSGIPNYAFFIAATAHDQPSWEGVGRVWYGALANGRLPWIAQAVWNGWQAVGVIH
jgi:Zn-dependent metalloprotease